MTTFKNKTVLITGGAGGIGKIMGRKSLERGAKQLIIWDIDKKNSEKTVNEFSEKGFNVFAFCVDVGNTEYIITNAGKVKKKFGKVDILINNAGIIVGKMFDEHSHEEIDKTIKINLSALMHVTKEFLPGMIESKEGHIVNIASAAGMLPNPKMSVYAASKWAVLGWSESLRIELENNYGRNKINVTTITPSYIDTGMFEGIKAPVLTPILKPEKISEKIIRAVNKNKLFLRAPFIVYLLPFLKGILPVRCFDLLVGKGFKIYRSMENFSGRKN